MINLNYLDYLIIAMNFAVTLFFGLYFSRKSSSSSEEYFLSGRNMPWWLLGFSMVATTFSTDTPNLITNMVRKNGVSGNWEWWAFLLTGLLTVFVYAKLWRKSNLKTDVAFYEVRYGGVPAKFLRAFRALYLGFIFNILAMSAVMLAAIKIGQVMLNFSAFQTLGLASFITLIFSTIGGFRGVIYADFALFIIAMAGSILTAFYCLDLPEIGGIDSLLKNENVLSKISILPDYENKELFISLLVIPLAVQWWSSWYPGGEPGGGGYIAQRMLSAKNENHAIGATFFFNALHYALRPWPWIIVALCSLIIYPNIESIHTAFPHVEISMLGDDLAYSAMLTKLPNGMLGLVLASLLAAYMSTIATHLNWGSSYLVYDFYKTNIRPNASEKELVNMGKVFTGLLIIISSIVAVNLKNALQIFNFILMFGAGTGLIFILRWFWWRINSWSEISGMFASGIISFYFNSFDIGEFEYVYNLPSWSKLPLSVLITTIVWIIVTFVSKPESNETLLNFYKKVNPGGPGWKKIISLAKKENINIETNEKWHVPHGILAQIIGCIFIYSILFSTGYLIYKDYSNAYIFIFLTFISGFFLKKIWNKISKTI